MIIEHLEKLLRDEAEERAGRPNNPFRASSMGRCIREGCFDLLGLKGEPLQPRRMLVLKGGSCIHDDLLTPLLKKAMGQRFLIPPELNLPEYVEIDGVKISYHIDGAFKFDPYDRPSEDGKSIGIIEIKSMSDFAFNRAMKGEIEHDYLCQGWIYFKGTNFNPVVFVAYRKETSAMVEIIFDRAVNEKVLTQTLTGDPIALAKNDPILLTEIRTPFDESVEGYVRERIKYLKLTQNIAPPYGADWVRMEVPGADAVEDEVEKVQGNAAVQKRAAELGVSCSQAVQNGSWWTLKTGRKILKFPCSYCAHMKRCYPDALMEMRGDRPVFVVGG